MRNPNWTREELILALNLYMRFRGSIPGEDAEPVAELSSTLRDLARLLGIEAADTRFRSKGAVHGKLENFKRLDPLYPGIGLPAGSRLDEDVWNQFSRDLGRLHRAADLIRRQIRLAERFAPLSMDEDEGFPEGKLAQRLHSTRERSPKLVRRKKERAMAQYGCLRCEVCGFDFEVTYGQVGQGFIECHHLIPVAEWPADEPTTTRLDDTILVCSNCHRMLHRKRPWPSVADLQEMVRRRGHD